MDKRRVLIFLVISLIILIPLIFLVFFKSSSSSSSTTGGIPPSGQISNTGFAAVSESGFSAMAVGTLTAFSLQNNDYYIFVKTPSGGSNKVQITENGKINVSYYKNSTKEIFPGSNQTKLITITKTNDLETLLNRLRGKNIILNFFLDNPNAPKEYSKSVLECNSSNFLNTSKALTANCIPFTSIISAYDP